MKMTLSGRIVVGTLAGVALGLFIGERAAPLQVGADAYIRLLQMTVLPYVVVSLISGLGGLTADQAKNLLQRVGTILVLFWAVGMAFAFLIPLTFPRWESASFYSSSDPGGGEDFDFLGLYIPTNPFSSLANNVVPAVVLFSVVIGVALIGVKDKEHLLRPLQSLARAIARVNHAMVELAPYGLFFTAASLAGTMHPEELRRVEVYLVAYCAVSVLLVAWVLPGLVAVLTPARYGEVLPPARDAILTAALTSSLFAVLPMLGEIARDILARHAPGNREAAEAPDVVVPASFNFPHVAKILSLSFIPFAAWFAESPLHAPGDYVRLAGAGLLSFFGSLNAAIPFLLDLFHLPQDVFHLFNATAVINARVGSAVSAMHTLTLGILGGFAMAGMLRVNRVRLARYLVITAGLSIITLGGLRLLFEHGMAQEYAQDKVLASMERTLAGVDARVYREAPPPLAEPRTGSLLERIAARKRLRVGYRPDNPPYSFFNASGDLVGFDVEMAHELAAVLGVSLEFVPVRFETLEQSVLDGCCDVLMSGVVVTAPRAARVTFTAPYMEEHLGFLVSDHERARYASREALRAAGPVRLGIPIASFPLERLRVYAPEARIVPLVERASLERFLAGDRGEVDCLVVPGERGGPWSLRHPRLAAVVPDPPIMTLPVAYVVGEGDERLRVFMNAWIDLAKRDGTIAGLTDYWVYGRNAVPRKPRWCVLDDVLGWTK